MQPGSFPIKKVAMLTVLFLFTFAVTDAAAYISKNECFHYYQLHLQRAFENKDTSGFAAFRTIVNTGSFDEKYQMFDSLVSVLVDSLAFSWKMDYLYLDVIDPIYSTFWEPLYMNDIDFFRYALLQCEKKVPSQLTAYYSIHQFTLKSIKQQRWVLDSYPDSNLCLRSNYGFVDSVATLIMADGSLPKSYRKFFAGMDKYTEPIHLRGNEFTLTIDSTFQGKLLYSLYSLDSAFIAVAGDSGFVAIANGAKLQWRKISPFSTNTINNIVFLTKAKGYCIENGMNIWSTTDSGTTWQRADVPQAMYEKMVVFDSTRLLLLDSFNGNLLTTDGGTTWVKVPATTYSLAPSVTSPTSAFTLSSRQLRKTVDGGATWIDVALLDTSYYPQRFVFLDEYTGLVGGDMGNVGITTDGGMHWQHRDPPTVERIAGILQSTGSSTILITDGFSVFSTRDTGISWTAEHVYYPTRLKTGVQISRRKSVWVDDKGLLFFCDAAEALIGSSGRNPYPRTSVPSPYSCLQRSFTLDGKVISAHKNVPGIRLLHGGRSYSKTLRLQP
jgi:photosystem II stability/assembly factor-like uncharacterized protein